MSKIHEEITIAIETSGRLGSAAINRGDRLISEVAFSGFMRHGAELLGVLEGLLAQADATAQQINKCYITAGPGSFTGLRIAVTTAKMLYMTHGVEIVAADTLEVIAQNAVNVNTDSPEKTDAVAVILDAKKGFFYAAVFDLTENGTEVIYDTQIVTPEQLLDWVETNAKQHVGLLGEGLVYYAKQFESPSTFLMDDSLWSAKASGLMRVGHRMAAQGLFADPLTLTPKYLRQPDAAVKRP